MALLESFTRRRRATSRRGSARSASTGIVRDGVTHPARSGRTDRDHGECRRRRRHPRRRRRSRHRPERSALGRLLGSELSRSTDCTTSAAMWVWPVCTSPWLRSLLQERLLCIELDADRHRAEQPQRRGRVQCGVGRELRSTRGLWLPRPVTRLPRRRRSLGRRSAWARTRQGVAVGSLPGPSEPSEHAPRTSSNVDAAASRFARPTVRMASISGPPTRTRCPRRLQTTPPSWSASGRARPLWHVPHL